MLSVYSAKAKQKLYVLNAKGVWLGQTNEAGSQPCYYKDGIQMVAKIDRDVWRAADAISELTNQHFNSKKSFLNDMVFSAVAFQYVPIA